MKRKYFVLLAVMGNVILLDQFTKYVITRCFHLGETLSIIPEFFNLTYIRNSGAAFNLFSTLTTSLRIPFLLIVPIVALVVIGYVFSTVVRQDLSLAVALSLVISGAMSNLIDRIVNRFVIDFLDFYWKTGGPHFPAFNVADIAIFIGGGLLIIDIVRKIKEKKRIKNILTGT